MSVFTVIASSQARKNEANIFVFQSKVSAHFWISQISVPDPVAGIQDLPSAALRPQD